MTHPGGAPTAGGPDTATPVQHRSGPREPEIRVALVDDHHLVREGVRAVLDAQPGILVVGEAADRVGAFELVAGELPDVHVLVLDVTLPGADGIAILREVAGAGRACG